MKNIFPHLVSKPSLADQKTKELRSRLDAFYSSTIDYSAFNCEQDQSCWLRLLEPYIDSLLEKYENIRVLEIGAGRSGFSKHFKKKMDKIEFHVQDVTSANKDYLETVANEVHIGDLSDVPGIFHLIFSTFVFEHVANPTEFLVEVDKRLIAGGVHAVFCPKYDFPGYVCPSLRHLHFLIRYLTSVRLFSSMIWSRISGETRFWVNFDPAVFHVPWYRDADAVNLVTRSDIEIWHRQYGYQITILKPSTISLRDFVNKRFMILSMAAIKTVRVMT